MDRPEGETRLDQIISYLSENSNIPVVDLRPALLGEKKNALLYRETDTHWNSNGAFSGYKVVREEIEKLFPEIDFGEEIKYNINSRAESGGDLLLMMGVENYGTLSIFDYNPEKQYPYIFEKDQGRDGVVTAVADKAASMLPRAVIFRDSYFSDLQPFVSLLFSEANYHWKLFENKDKEAILSENPDVVIFEVIERYLDSLIFVK